MPTRYTISFTGHVQGVGFRFATARVADGHDVAGWVRNEADGSVACVVEGEKVELDAFVDGIRAAKSGHLSNVRFVESAATGEFSGFAVRY